MLVRLFILSVHTWSTATSPDRKNSYAQNKPCDHGLIDNPGLMKLFAYLQTSKPTISKLLRPENITKIRSIVAGVQPSRSGGGGQVDEEGARREGPREGGITGESGIGGRESQEARYGGSIKARVDSEGGNTDIHTGSVRGNTQGAPYPFSALVASSAENGYGHPPSCQGPQTLTLFVFEGLRVQGEEEHGNGRGLGAGLMQVTSMHEAQGHGMVCLSQTTSLSHHK